MNKNISKKSAKISHGTVHKVPADMRALLESSPSTLAVWEDITPLARNEWICWTTSVKKAETRADHIRQIKERLAAGKRRPCCWAGCNHR